MLTIRPIQPATDAEYQVLVDLNNRAWPTEPESVASRRYSDENRPAGKVHQRFVAEESGRLLAEGIYLEAFWSEAQDKYYYRYAAHPEREDDPALHQAIYEFVLGQLSDRKPKALFTGAREDRPFRIRWLESQGFVPKMRFAVSELDLTGFNFGRFNGALERPATAGVTILPLAELMETDPNWQNKLYDMLWEIEQDIPHVDPPRREPFDEFLKTFAHPNFWAEAWFMAVDPSAGDDGVGAYVGVSMLGKNPPMPKRINTWLTGVVRSHRRKGIALAMKLRAIEFAIQQGGTAIRTDNEENNPMLGINKMLGFVEIPAEVAFDKEL